MTFTNRWIPLLVLLFGPATVPAADTDALEKAFENRVKPFLKQHCVRCHNADKMTSGVRIDHLDAKLDDKQLRLWEVVLKQTSGKVMPPEGAKQPTDRDREQAVAWIEQALRAARS